MLALRKVGVVERFLEGLVWMMDSADLEVWCGVVMQILNKKRKFCKNG